MATKFSPNGGRYLYAIIEGIADHQYGRLGVNDKHVYAITNGLLSAVVSDSRASETIRPERRHLKAHQEVLKRLMQETTPLPMAFGIVADGPKAVKDILTRNKEILLEQLGRVKGKMEMGLRVTWDVPNIFEYFVRTHADLRAARDRYFGTNRDPSPEDKIELGRMFDALLEDDRENYAEQVEELLSGYCFEIIRNKCRNERDVMSLVCLVGRDEETQFEEGIIKAAGLFDNNFAFDYNGPWAPHNFVDIDLVI